MPDRDLKCLKSKRAQILDNLVSYVCRVSTILWGQANKITSCFSALESTKDCYCTSKITPRADQTKIDGPGWHGVFGVLGVGEGVGLGGRRSDDGGLGRLVRHGRKPESE